MRGAENNWPRHEQLALVFLVALLLLPSLAAQMMKEELRARDPAQLELWARTQENGGWYPDTLRLPANQTVRLRLISLDVVHGFRIDNPNGSLRHPLFVSGPLNSDLAPVVVELPPLPAGEYTFSYSVSCSQMHTSMKGRLIIG